jgi:hypothetical protein
VVVAAGDIACASATPTRTSCVQQATSDLLLPLNPDAALALGDLQYVRGAYDDFRRYYASTWGRARRVTHPAPGNHDYLTAGAQGYFDYFNRRGNNWGRARSRTRGYYSFNVGGWHVVALNSACTVVSCRAGSGEERWLRNDLATHNRRCTLAFDHYARFSSGFDGNRAEIDPLWDALYDAASSSFSAGMPTTTNASHPWTVALDARARHPAVRRRHRRRIAHPVRPPQPGDRRAEQRQLRRPQAHAAVRQLPLAVRTRRRPVAARLGRRHLSRTQRPVANHVTSPS